MMMSMERNWNHLAEAIRDARLARGMTQDDLAQLAQVARATVQNLEQGRTFQRVPPSLARVAAALGWSPDRPAAILEGRSVVETELAALLSTASARLPKRIAQEITTGEVLDTDIIDLVRPNGARIVVIVKRNDEGTPEQLQADMAAWSDMQRTMRSLAG
jgi:transcriptional regulator with XRE-family HTH domain